MVNEKFGQWRRKTTTRMAYNKKRTFEDLPDWLKKNSNGSNRPMVWIIPHANFLESKGYEYPFNDVPEGKRQELYLEFRNGGK